LSAPKNKGGLQGENDPGDSTILITHHAGREPDGIRKNDTNDV
jgi:hypothetical protein